VIFKRSVFLILLFLTFAGFLSCGIEEYYYLPQLPESNITRNLNTEAFIDIPPISDQYYYAGYYAIFYRIYTSNHLTTSASEFSQISPSLTNDYNFFYPITNPANTSSITLSNTFSSRNYFELEYEGENSQNFLPTSGGTVRIQFPTAQWGIPTASFNDGSQIPIIRSSRLISPEPRDNFTFRNTPELRDSANATSNINADVASRTGTMQYAYVSMYIVAVGTNPVNFTQVYSKPTHISVFKLPDTY